MDVKDHQCNWVGQPVKEITRQPYHDLRIDENNRLYREIRILFGMECTECGEPLIDTVSRPIIERQYLKIESGEVKTDE